MSNISYSTIITIMLFEIKDFFKEFQFNVLGPLINTLLFFLIISTIHKYYLSHYSIENYMEFLIPGMVMAVVMQTSFGHLSQVIIRMKQIGSFNDYLMSPISRVEIFFSFLMSSLFVCMIVGIINLLSLSFFVDFKYINYFNLFYYLIITIVIFSTLGALTGFLSFSWDTQSTISNFFIVPLSFLSGTFFQVEAINKDWQFIFNFNPFFYLVNGFRSSFNEYYKINIYNEIYIILIFLLCLILTSLIFKKGYRVIS